MSRSKKICITLGLIAWSTLTIKSLHENYQWRKAAKDAYETMEQAYYDQEFTEIIGSNEFEE